MLDVPKPPPTVGLTEHPPTRVAGPRKNPPFGKPGPAQLHRTDRLALSQENPAPTTDPESRSHHGAYAGVRGSAEKKRRRPFTLMAAALLPPRDEILSRGCGVGSE